VAWSICEPTRESFKEPEFSCKTEHQGTKPHLCFSRLITQQVYYSFFLFRLAKLWRNRDLRQLTAHITGPRVEPKALCKQDCIIRDAPARLRCMSLLCATSHTSRAVVARPPPRQPAHCCSFSLRFQRRVAVRAWLGAAKNNRTPSAQHITNGSTGARQFVSYGLLQDYVPRPVNRSVRRPSSPTLIYLVYGCSIVSPGTIL
jgi:hypothetical protein